MVDDFKFHGGSGIPGILQSSMGRVEASIEVVEVYRNFLP